MLTVYTELNCKCVCVCTYTNYLVSHVYVSFIFFSLQHACVCMCWNLGHPLWLCVWEADQSTSGAATHMGVFVWGHAHTEPHLALRMYEQREKAYTVWGVRVVQGCFHYANTLQRNTNRRHSHLNCTHTFFVAFSSSLSSFQELRGSPSFFNAPTPHLQTNTHMHIHIRIHTTLPLTGWV